MFVVKTGVRSGGGGGAFGGAVSLASQGVGDAGAGVSMGVDVLAATGWPARSRLRLSHCAWMQRSGE